MILHDAYVAEGLSGPADAASVINEAVMGGGPALRGKQHAKILLHSIGSRPVS